MSIPGNTLGLAAIQAGGLIILQSLAGRVPRNMGGIVAQVTVEENAVDQMAITEHPVEQGAAISDHAFKRPARVTIRAGWSNSPSPVNTGLINIPGNILSGLASTLDAFSGPSSYVRAVYDRLLVLQASAQPFTVVTGKRVYPNMLFETLGQITDQNNENSLAVVATCKQVIIVRTQVISAVPPRAVQKLPQYNAPTENNGAVQLQPAPNFNANGAG
jgi:hypothetical protein